MILRRHHQKVTKLKNLDLFDHKGFWYQKRLELKREITAHQRCSTQLRETQEDAGHFEAEAAALRERALELQMALDDKGRQLAKASTALWQERQISERLRTLCEDDAGIHAPAAGGAEGVVTSSPVTLLTADVQQLGALVDAAEAAALVPDYGFWRRAVPPRRARRRRGHRADAAGADVLPPAARELYA